MRLVTCAVAAALAAAGCGEGAEADRQDASPSGSGADRGSGGTLVPTVDMFSLPDVGRRDAGAPDFSSPADSRATDTLGSDLGASADGGADVGPPPPLPPGAGLAAGAAPLRSARYRLFGVVGPAAAVGATLTSEQHRLESGPVLWITPGEEPSR